MLQVLWLKHRTGQITYSKLVDAIYFDLVYFSAWYRYIRLNNWLWGMDPQYLNLSLQINWMIHIVQDQVLAAKTC